VPISDDDLRKALTPGNASEAIVAAALDAQSAGARLTVLTIGPLTNLSLALRDEPSLTSMCELIVLGACGNGRGNVTRSAEFNIFADPEAAKHVFSQDWASPSPLGGGVMVLPWELLLSNPLPWADFDRIFYSGFPALRGTWPPPAAELGPAADPSPIARILAAACKLPFVERREMGSSGPGSEDDEASGSGAIICDAVAVAVALVPEMILSSEYVHVDVETAGELTRGQTVVDWGHASDSADRPRTVQWVTSIEPATLTRLLQETLPAGKA